jgi:hypothetical protein
MKFFPAPIKPRNLNIDPVVPKPGIRHTISFAGQTVQVTSANALGGYIINPQGAFDVLYVDPTGPAANRETATTIALPPGQRFDLPPESFLGVWCNSNFANHNFIVIQILPLAPPEPPYIKGDFPPDGPTGLLHPIWSYLYEEYSDDNDLQAFVRAYNIMQQNFITAFLNLNLPIYTKDPISGALLDWVGVGLYGFPRPSLSYSFPLLFGPYNTGQYNTQEYNWYQYIPPTGIALVNDDIYRRCITWHFSKRDGKYFNVEWLKKRIMRFLIGENGTQPNIDNAYQISVTFGPNCGATIRIVLGQRIITNSAEYNDNSFQYNVRQYNEINFTYISLPPLPNMETFAQAIKAGVLELPFQFNWTDVVIG